MKKATILSVVFILVGSIIFLTAMSISKWDFKRLSTVEYETNEYVLTDGFDGVDISTKTADINFVITEDSTAKVVCYEEKDLKHSVTVSGGVLSIKVEDNRNFLKFLRVDFNSPKITVYLPSKDYGNLKVNASTSNVSVENAKFSDIDIFVSTGDVTVKNQALSGNLSVEVSTGKTSVENVTCKNLFTEGSTGKVFLKNVIAEQKITVERSTGDIEFDGIDGSEIFIETSTGDVVGSVLSDKIFTVETSTGRKSAPNTTSGGICKITTSTGDAIVTIKN
ncbi:MAG: DUF4097 family beta strand repeat protein [Clostridia bacterium]|nr:DUF4097 family beta strand repeat protein [Clostridia bacterium]